MRKIALLVALLLMLSICPAYGEGMAGTGSYTFYNAYTGCYLSCKDRSVILSQTPQVWALAQIYDNTYHLCPGDTGLLLDIDNAYVHVGSTVKVWEPTGYDVQLWNILSNPNGTCYIAYSGDNRYCLGFDNGNAVLQFRDETNPMQEWIIADCSASVPKEYLSFRSQSKIIELRLPLDILSVISESRLNDWADHLETAFNAYVELTNFIPFNEIIVEAYKPSEYIGWVVDGSNIIHIDIQFLYQDLAKMAARGCDWNFCALHEMGHMFDFGRAWNFESELMTDLKLAYVLETQQAAAAPSEFDASTVFTGAEIINAYRMLGSDFSSTYDIFGCTARFLEIKQDIGWEPFVETFHHFQQHTATYADIPREHRLDTFVELLTYYSGQDIRSYFSTDEWNTMQDYCKS